SPAELGLFPDTEGTAAVSFTLPRDFPAGLHTATVEVAGTVSHEDDRGPVAGALTGTATAPITLLVEPVYDAALTLEPQSVTAGGRARYTVVAENRGNVPLTMALAATDGEQALRFRFAANEITVPPGRRVRAAMHAKGKRPFLGTPKPRILTVRGTANQALPTETLGTFIQKPLVPRALLTMMAILIALGLWGAVLFRGVNRAATQVAAQVDPQGGGGSAVIVGRVTDGRNGLGGVKLVAKGKKGSAETMSLSEGDIGAFAIEDLAGPDTYMLTLTAEGFATQSVPVKLKNGEGKQAGLIAMDRGRGSVTGTVTSTAGQPLGSVAVSLVRNGFTVGRAVSDSAGSIGFYSVGGLESTGPYLVTFSYPGYISQSKEVAVAADAPATVDAILVPSTEAVITGLVTSSPVKVPACKAGECPLAGVTVTVSSAGGNQSTVTASAPAGEAGRYTVAGLTSGSYTVTFTKAGFVPQTLRVTLEVGQPVTVNVTMQGEPGILSGTAPGCTAVDARRRDLSELNPRRLVAPAEDGAYTLGDLPTPGEYRIVFRGPQPRTIDVNLGPGEQRQLNASCTSAPAPSTTSTSTSTSTTTTSSSTTTTTLPQEQPPSTTTTTTPNQGAGAPGPGLPVNP
ncbi:MAG TPA: carboxypeptidase-like regulatory domain-containing protein, partial [Acidimicrobiia bacterium]|nr:carboxypeptidase-like regulatory domain-containing protein [Acidimicrobiia bacterium]